MTLPLVPVVAESDEREAKRRLRGDRWIGVGLFLLVFLVYGRTLCPTVYTGDDGDFLTAMATGGVAHPTGYPLFTLLGRLALVPPAGADVPEALARALTGHPDGPALRVNLMTALFGAAAAALFFRFLARLVPGRPWAAAAAALLLAFAPTPWQQSLSCEVYALTCLFLALLLYLAALWYEHPGRDGLLGLMAFAYGLALTNHMTVALFLPGFLALVLARRPGLWREPRGRLLLLRLAVPFALPLLLYLYLPLAAAARPTPPVPWGSPATWELFKAHVTGEQFRGLMFSGMDVFRRQSAHFGVCFLSEWGLWLLWLLPIGIARLWRTHRPFCFLLGYIAAANLLHATNYDVFDVYVFYLPSYLVTAAFLGVGASAITDAARDRLRLRGEARTRAARLAAVAALALPVVQMSLHFGSADKSGNFLEEDFAANVLRSAPPGALVVNSSNLNFTLWYQRFVLGQRKDVVPVHKAMARGMFSYGGWYYQHLKRLYPDIRNTYPDHTATEDQVASGEFLIRMMKRAAERGVPVLVVPDPRYDARPILGNRPSFDAQVAAVFDRVPWGVAERLYLKGAAPAPAALLARNETMWATFSLRGLDAGPPADPMQAHIGRRYAEAGLSLAATAGRAGRPDLAAAFTRIAEPLKDLVPEPAADHPAGDQRQARR